MKKQTNHGGQVLKPVATKTEPGPKKGGKSHFGYKLHTKSDIIHGLIRELETTSASVHDSQIDLSQQGEVVYRDRGYFGASCKGYNATMNRATRGHPLQ